VSQRREIVEFGGAGSFAADLIAALAARRCRRGY
jgi:hypothetical protein